jgi:hypothetical protein
MWQAQHELSLDKGSMSTLAKTVKLLSFGSDAPVSNGSRIVSHDRNQPASNTEAALYQKLAVFCLICVHLQSVNGAVTINIMTLSIMTFSITDKLRHFAQHFCNSECLLFYCNAECRYAECRYTECRGAV